MLDLWFGLDASGFDKASAPRQIRAILTFFHEFGRSFSSPLRSGSYGNVRMSE